MGKFNLNQLLNTASMAGNSAAQSEEARRLPLKVVSLNIRDLVPSKNNFYSVENIEELKTSIEIFGVLQNLTVKPLDNGKYEIISGHRRNLSQRARLNLNTFLVGFSRSGTKSKNTSCL